MLLAISQTNISIIIWLVFLACIFWVFCNADVKYQLGNTDDDDEETFYIPASKIQPFISYLNKQYPNYPTLSYMQLTEAWNEFLTAQNQPNHA